MKNSVMAVLAFLGMHLWGDMSPQEQLSEFLIGMAADDISDENEFVPTTVENDCSVYLAEHGMTASQLVASVSTLVREMTTDTAVSTNSFVYRVYSCGLAFLSDYAGTDASQIFAYTMTNCVAEEIVDLASYCYCKKNMEVNCGAGIYSSPEFWNIPTPRRARAVDGLCWALDSHGGSAAVTNRILGMTMRLLPKGESFGHFDRRLIAWWPAYATSSNRYVAAQLAREANPPCASSNYLARVIAGLEALPPGTMQMLSTNHLGQAWQE